MNKAILIKLGNGIEASSFLRPNQLGEVYLNLASISIFSFDSDEITFKFSEPSETPHCISFSKDSLGEYHRIKREIEDFMCISKK